MSLLGGSCIRFQQQGGDLFPSGQSAQNPRRCLRPCVACGHSLRLGLFLIKSGKSPYEGWSYHGAPLLLPLFKYTSHDDLGCTLPFIGVDLLAAWILRKTQKILSLGQGTSLVNHKHF